MKEFENENNIKERFYLCYSFEQLKILKNHGYRYLFVCQHGKNGRKYFVYDKTNELMELIKEYRESKKSKTEME